jgi:hypothetical protein
MIGIGMTGASHGESHHDREDWDLTEEQHRELLREARARVPVLREIAATNIAEIERLREEYARRVSRRRRWRIFG